jgi:aminopeptidase N
VTQFEEIDATRAFPCWEEPAVKATFDITLVVPKDHAGLYNMVYNLTNCFDFGLLNICTLYSQ